MITTNVCTHCGLTTTLEHCAACSKAMNRTVYTTPWAVIPQTCWDCGAPLTLPPHLREYLAQCPDCTYKHRAKTN